MTIIDGSSVQFKIGKLPEDIADRLRYLYRLQEKLRVYHNIYCKDYKDGTITLEELHAFQNLWFEPRNMLLCEFINECKKFLENDDTTLCDIDDIEEK